MKRKIYCFVLALTALLFAACEKEPAITPKANPVLPFGNPPFGDEGDTNRSGVPVRVANP